MDQRMAWCTMCEGPLDKGLADEGTSCEGAEHEKRLEIVLIINNNTKGTAGSKNLSCLFGKTKWNTMKIATPMKIGCTVEGPLDEGLSDEGTMCEGPMDEGLSDEGTSCEGLRRRKMRKTIVTTGKM